jgi:hypothetical protein
MKQHKYLTKLLCLVSCAWLIIGTMVFIAQPKASAYSPAEAQECYNSLNNKVPGRGLDPGLVQKCTSENQCVVGANQITCKTSDEYAAAQTGQNQVPKTKDECTKKGGTWANNACTLPAGAGGTAAAEYAKYKTEADCKKNGGLWENNACNAPGQQDTSCPLPDDADMRWLACAVVAAGQLVTNKLYSLIQDYMYIDTGSIFGNNAQSTVVHDASKSFRNFGIALVLVAGLIMVIAQASGTELVDAYTIRKTLPRLGVALIGIALAWPLMHLAVVVSNDLGMLVGDMLSSLATSDNAGLVKSNVAFQDSAIGSILTLGGIGVLVAGVSAWGALSFIWTIVVALLIGMFVLAIRQIVVITCIMIAPLAIASYVLPGTQKLWEFWKKTFTTTLLMFPIVMLFLGSGRALSNVIGAGSPDSKAATILAVVVFFAPYFMLPFAFKMAGGLMSTIFSIANDRSRGIFDRPKKFRQGQLEKNLGAMKQGTRFSKNMAAGRFLNRATRGAGLMPSAGLNPLAVSSRYSAANAQRIMDEATEIRTKNPDFALGAEDDRILRAASNGRGRSGIRKWLEEKEDMHGVELDNAVGIAERMQKSGSQQAVQAAVALQLFATGTGYNDPITKEFDYNKAMTTIRDAAGNDRNLAGRILGQSKGIAGQAGQVAFGGASYGKLSDGLDQAFKHEAVSGDRIALDAFTNTDAATASRGRDPHVRAMTRAVTNRITKLNDIVVDQDISATERQQAIEERSRLLAQYENFADTATMYGAPGKQNVIVDQGRAITTTKQTILSDSHPDVKPGHIVPDAQQHEINLRHQTYAEYRSGRRIDPNDPRLSQQQQPERKEPPA